MNRRIRVFTVLVAFVAVMVFQGAARADDLYVGGNYNQVPLVSLGNEGGGSVTVSSLNGRTLPWLYCADLYITIGVPGDYNQTTVSYAGYVTDGLVHNAGEVAWLLDHYANSAIGDPTAQIALQAAIWNQIYGVALDPGSSAITDYNSDLAALGSNTAPLSDVAWFTPKPGDNQGLVGPVPDGGMTLMLLGGALVGLGVLRRKFGV